jgi:hypothetical protein
LFVTICDHAISLRHTSRGKIKTAFKIAFLGPVEIVRALVEKVFEAIERALVALPRINDKANGIIAVKETFNNTLKVIQTVGGFVADGASQVRDTRPH